MHTSDAVTTWYRATLRTAVIAGIFLLLVGGVMVANYARLRAANPYKAPQLTALKTKVFQGKDLHAASEYRQLEARYNQRYAAASALTAQGLHLLYGGAALFLLMAGCAAALRRRLPDPATLPAANPWSTARAGRTAVAAFGIIVGGTLIGFAAIPPPIFSLDQKPAASPEATAQDSQFDQNLLSNLQTDAGNSASSFASSPPLIDNLAATATVADTPPLPPPSIKPNSTPPAPAHVVNTTAGDGYFPTAEDVAKNWATFRGPGGNAVAAGDAPLDWDAQSGKQLRWKTTIPLGGKNSPIVWGDRVFLCGADAKARQIYCYDAGAGTLLWTADVTGIAGSPATTPNVNEETGFAAPTMAADGKRVFAIFPNADLVCYDFAGKRVWAKNLGLPESTYGYAASLAMYRNRLIVQFDQGSSADDGKSSLLALDAASGQTAWAVKARPVPNSWSSPIVATINKRDEIITCGNPWVIGYDAKDGQEIWRAQCLGGDVASTPIYAGGLVVACQAYGNVSAISPIGTRDITKRAIAWTASDGVPDITSPASNGELLFLVTTQGTVTCYQMKSGQKLWEHDLDATCYASPVIVKDRVYQLDEKGTMHIFQAGNAYKELGKATLADESLVHASPAVVCGRIYIRGKATLYCIGGKE